jgi:hypothetical protein
MGARQKRPHGELARVAEMVIVLAAAGEARGRWLLTATERAPEAEARGKLPVVIEEAVCALVEDLGLDQAYDPSCRHGVQPAQGLHRRLETVIFDTEIRIDLILCLPIR